MVTTAGLRVLRCVFGSNATQHQTFAAEVGIPFQPQDDQQFVDCYITCKLNAMSGTLLDSLTLWSNTHLLAEVPLESVVLSNATKGIGMCLGPVYSYIPQFVDWLMYHSVLGAEGIHAYSPVLDQSQKKGSGFFRPPFLLYHFLLDWTLYKTPLHYPYFGQRLAYNDCIYRHRHLYMFIFVYDADEFIYFPSKMPDSLVTWLATTVPANASAASLHCARYDAGCRNEFKFPRNVQNTTNFNQSELYQTYNHSFFHVDLYPVKIVGCRASDGWCTMKSIVRPLAIKAYNVHYPQVVYPGWEFYTSAVDPEVAIYKHIRCEKWTTPGKMRMLPLKG
eukprot:jgi/Botrbrau1/8644/Bobra.0196s0038.1